MSDVKRILEVEEDPNDPDNCVITFPQDLLDAAGWKPGDAIIWKDNGDGSWTLTRKD